MPLTWEFANSSPILGTEIFGAMDARLRLINIQDSDTILLNDYCKNHSAQIIDLAHIVASKIPTNITLLLNIFGKIVDLTSRYRNIGGSVPYIKLIDAYHHMGITHDTQTKSGSSITIDCRNGEYYVHTRRAKDAIRTHTENLLKIKCWVVLYDRTGADEVSCTDKVKSRLLERIPAQLFKMLAYSRSCTIQMCSEIYMMSSIISAAADISHGNVAKLLSMTTNVQTQETIRQQMPMIRRSLESFVTTSAFPSRACTDVLLTVAAKLLELNNNSEDKLSQFVMRTPGLGVHSGKNILQFIRDTGMQRSILCEISLNQTAYYTRERNLSRGRQTFRQEPRIRSSSRRRSTSSGIAEYFIDKLHAFDIHSFASREQSRVRSQPPAGRGRESSFQT
jgi:hypothetical protein